MIIFTVFTVVAGVTWLAGGFGRAQLPRLAAGESIRGNRFRFQPLRAWASDEHPRGYGNEPAKSYLVVAFAVTNFGRETATPSDVHEVLRVRTAPGGKLRGSDETFLLGAAAGSQLHPGMPVRLAAVWELGSGSQNLAEVTVVIADHRLVTNNFAIKEAHWRAGDRLATATLPVVGRSERENG